MIRKLSRSFILALLLILLAVLITGCGNKNDKKASSNKSGPAKTAVVVGYEEEPEILNPMIIGGDLTATTDIAQNILPNLFSLNSDFEYEPSLLDGQPEVRNDPFTIIYKLRKDAVWSDGKPITSADLLFTWQTIMDQKWEILDRSGYDLIERIDIPDPQTAVAVFKEPYAPWRDLFSVSTFILPEHILKGKDFNKIWNREITISGGPFMFKEWRSGEFVKMVKNPKFWGKKAQLESLTLRFIPDTNTLVQQLKADELDVINPSPEVSILDQLKADDNVKVSDKPGIRWEHLAFNVESPAVQDVAVRKAIGYAIDRKSIAEKLMRGTVKPLQSVLVPEQKEFYEPAWEQYKYKPKKAEDTLEKAGYKKGNDGIFAKSGKKITINLSTTAGAPARERLEQIIQAQLKSAGIEVKIKNADADTFFGWIDEGQYDMAIFGMSGTTDPSLTSILDENLLPPDGQNYYRYKNAEVTKLLNEQDKEVDVSKRAKTLKEIQELTADDIPFLPLYQLIVIAAYQDTITGVTVNPTLEGLFGNSEDWAFSK